MLLPPPLFEHVANHFDHHNCWHLARHPGQEQLRLRFAGECGQALMGLDQKGSGCDFLAFHRRMMRHFAWLLDHHPAPLFHFEPWQGPRLPDWVERAVLKRDSTFDLEFCYTRIAKLVASGDIETLGGFIEPNVEHSGTRGAGLHGRVHFGIAAKEGSMYGGDETSPMSNLGRSPGNIFFWTLHQWIDDVYAACQGAGGEKPDRSPLKMPHVDVHCHGIADLMV